LSKSQPRTRRAQESARSDFVSPGAVGLGRSVPAQAVCLQLRLRVAVLHALTETLDGRTEIFADVAQFLGSENQRDDDEHDQPVPDAPTTHDLDPLACG